MKWYLITPLLCSVLAIAIAQNHDAKPPTPYGNSYPGYDSNKQSYGPPSHSNIKQSGSYPGANPIGYQPGYGGHSSGGYGGHSSGGYGAQYGGYNQWKHYDYCKPDYDSYPVSHRYQLNYLESASDDDLGANTSNFLPHPPIQGPANPDCEKGPKHILYSEHYEWHWPPVYKGVCDKLPGCKDPECISTKTVKKSVCVLVFRRYGYKWIRVGYRKITYKTDLSCKCRQCKDIKSYRQCVHEHPCPNEGNNIYSYCYWKKPYQPHDSYDNKKNSYDTHDTKTPYTPHDDDKKDHDDGYRSKRYSDDSDSYDRYDHYGDDKKDYNVDPYDTYKHPLYPVPAGNCDCCVPKYCIPPKKFDYDLCDCVCPKKKCLPGHKFNPVTCKCDCPKGTYFDKEKQKCIGKCKELNAKACENVVCKDNPHFYCKLDKKYNCRCPSCDDVDYWQRGLCEKTNCIEQGYKPYCVFDWRNGKCRCPECEDQKTPDACEKTSCTDPYKKNKKCKWVWYPYPSCQCDTKKYSTHDTKSGHNSHNPGYGTNKAGYP